MNSIIQHERKCFYCNERVYLDVHHCFAGNPNRKLSENYGLKVWLCRKHHTGNEPNDRGVHFDRQKDLALKQLAQQTAMEYYGWSKEDFIKIFGKNYLEE